MTDKLRTRAQPKTLLSLDDHRLKHALITNETRLRLRANRASDTTRQHDAKLYHEFKNVSQRCDVVSLLVTCTINLDDPGMQQDVRRILVTTIKEKEELCSSATPAGNQPHTTSNDSIRIS